MSGSKSAEPAAVPARAGGSRRRTRAKVLLVALVLGSVVWVVDTLQDWALFNASGGSFGQLLLVRAPLPYVLTRLLVMALLVGFGIVLANVIEARDKSLERSTATLARLEAILAALPDIVMEVDVNKVYTWANQAGYQFFGEEVIGREAASYFLGEQDTYEKVQPLFDGDPGLIYVESWQRRQDGERRLLAWWCRVLKDVDGKVLGALSTARDVTDERNAQQALAKSEERYRRLVEKLPDAVYRFSKSRGGLFWSPSVTDLLGFKPEDLVDDPFIWHDAIHPEDLPAVDAAIEGSLKGRAFDLVYRIRHASGEWRWLHDRSISIMQDGDEVEIEGIAADITQRKRNEEALRRYADELAKVNEEIRQFATVISHDLRAPLVSLGGFGTNLREDLASLQRRVEDLLPQLPEGEQVEWRRLIGERMPESLHYMEGAIDRMTRLVEAVLQLSRLGRRELTPESLDMDDIVEEVLKAEAHQIRERQVNVHCTPLPNAWADRAAAEMIWSNLLHNAVLYLDPDRAGRIDLGGEASEGQSLYHVRDNGRGIPAKLTERVFAPFRRAGDHEEPGEGMGLAYVQRLVRRLGGEIWFESEEGVGTTFFFSLPTGKPHTAKHNEREGRP